MNTTGTLTNRKVDPAQHRKIVFLGIPIDDLNMGETLDRIGELVGAGRISGFSHQVATVNVDFLVKARKDPSLMHILLAADLTTADGMPLVWGSRLLGKPALKERVAGSDLVPALAERAARDGFSVYLYGSAPGVAECAARILVERHPDLRIAGCYSPAFSKSLDIPDEALAQLREARPDILLVALGNPKQEKWIAHNRNKVHAPVMMGVGASLDFIAGAHRRAPVWMQRSGLEWLFRLLQEPSRLWRRYLSDLFVFGLMFAREWLDKNIKSRPIRSGQVSRRKGRKPVSSAEG